MTTGKPPPNADKGVFLHDTRDAGAKKKGKVYLELRATNGSTIGAKRSMVKEEGKDFRTVESSLTDLNRANEECPYRNKEYLRKMFGYLGVSNAVLGNVIFCYQDESLWMFSEDSSVKERLGAIFGITRYNTVLDSISELKKKQGNNLELYKEENVRLKKRKDEAVEKEKDLAEKKRERDQIEKVIKNWEKEEKEKTNSLSDIQMRIKKEEKLQEKIDEARKEKEDLEKDIKGILKRLDQRELEGSTKQLEKDQKEFDSEMKKLKDSLTECKQRTLKQSQEQQKLEKRRSELLVDVGKQQQAKETHEKNKKEIQAIAKDYGFVEFDQGQMTDETCARFEDHMKNRLEKMTVVKEYMDQMKKGKEHVEKTGKQIRKKESEAKELEMKIRTVCGDQKYEDKVQAAQQKLYDTQIKLGEQYLLKKYSDELKESQRCPLCHQGFPDDTAVQRLEVELKKKLRLDSDEQQTELEKQLKKDQEDYKKIVNLQATKDNMEKIQEREIPELKSQREEAQEGIRKLQAKIKAVTEKENIPLDQLSADIDKMKIMNNSVQTLRTEIKKYKGENLQERQQQQEKIDQQLKGVKKEQDKDNENILKLEKKLSSQKEDKQKLSDSLQLRKNRTKVQELEEKMEELKGQQGDLKVLKEQKKQVEEEKKKLEEQVNQEKGSKKQLEKGIKELERKLDLSPVKEYRDNLIKMKTTDLAIQDLTTCSTAIDTAILNYHRQRLEDVNQNIGALWRQIYQGNDIDRVEIKAEMEKKNRRTYNYRVVMWKGNQPLDMRGRGSSGQKVLASIIIRLALAEIECKQCGVIALDEPTTNLDKENTESLADALVRLIGTRQGQDLQLVVITHDKDFVRHLGQHTDTTEVLQVTKDDHGISRVEKKALRDLQ
ncbi:uncharacterized protein LOC143283664 [Babylonia areolata]|uniref:uncharacterized protein LOC143283664 n=1 Tax=Babylonia areolata TaxID=304850 RepID=UPI003FD666FD